MLLLTDKSLLLDDLAVVVLVLVDLTNVLLDLGAAGQQQVVDHVVHAGNVLFSVTDVLFKGDNSAVVLVGAALEVNVQDLETVVEVLDELLDGVD